jgi:hypothetical protein
VHEPSKKSVGVHGVAALRVPLSKSTMKTSSTYLSMMVPGPDAKFKFVKERMVQLSGVVFARFKSRLQQKS